MSETTHAHDEHHGTVLAHPDDTRHNAVAVLIGLIAIVLAIASYSLWVYFKRAAEELTYEVVLSRPNVALQELRAKELQELRGAAITDEAVHLPIEEAIGTFVREAQARERASLPQRIQPLAEAAGESTTP